MRVEPGKLRWISSRVDINIPKLLVCFGSQLPSGAARATYVAMPPFYYQNLNQPDEEGQLQDGTHMSWCDDRSSAGSVSPFFFSDWRTAAQRSIFEAFCCHFDFFCRDLYIDLVFRILICCFNAP